MRTVTSAVITAALGIAACSDALGPGTTPFPTEAPSQILPSMLIADGNGGFAPGAGDRVLFDARSGLQQATTLREALALWGLSQDTRAGWGFTTNFDGAGTHALRVDWAAQATGCTSLSPVIGRTLPTPAPKRLYAQWRQWLGRTATGGGLGEIGQFTVNRSECGSTYDRFVWMADRDGSSRRSEVKWLGPAPASPAVHVKGLSTTLRANQGWSFVPQEHTGETIVQTVYLQAESAVGAGDGIVRLWINGRLFVEYTGLALGPEGFTQFHFPWKSPAPATSQSEYFWDIMAWEPAAVAPQPVPVASVEVSPASATVEAGKSIQLTATPRDANGAALTGRPIIWSSSDPTVATVSSTGLVTAVIAGSATITATSENQSGTATITTVAPSPPPAGDLAPRVGDRVLFDARTALQQAATLRQALTLWGLSQDTRPGWGFTTDLDGAGTHALRVDWTAQATGCTSVSPVLGRALPNPKPTRIYAQWRQRLGRTATGGGLGEVGQFVVNRPECSSAYDRFVWMANREGSTRRSEVKWLGSAPASPGVFIKGLSGAFEANQGWSFSPQDHTGEAIVQTVYLQAESAPGANDGVIRFWINGRLFLEHKAVALGPEGFSDFHFPWKSAAPASSQSEYFWDHVVWEPAPEPLPPPVPVATVEVTPAAASVDVGRTLQLTATPRDAAGATLAGRTIAWVSSNPSVAQVSAAGIVTGVAAGTATVTATSEGQSGSSTITVIVVPVATVTVAPASASVDLGRTVQLTATLRDASGGTLTGRPITWTSLNPGVATVSGSGLVTGVTAGTANVFAMSEGKSDTSAITVVAAPPPPPPPNGLPVVPGVLGFGVTTPGGRGGTILRVTNLNDDGPGSLRAAITASGPRVIIFEVSGTIRVGANLVIANPFVTIAGQTAPSPGITLRGGEVRINTHDVVIQHLRFRPGDDPGATLERDGISLYGGSQEKYNIVIDHCSISWGVDENLSTGTASAGVRHDITFSNLIISEALDASIHPEGPHSKGILIGQGSKNIALTGTLMAHNLDRNPWFKGNTTGVIVNNVIYNYGGSKGTYFDDVDNTAAQSASVVGNVYLRGVNSPTNLPIRIYSGVKPGSLFYIADNSWDRAAPPSNPWSLVLNEDGASVVALSPPVWVPGLVAQPNANVESWVLSNAGARPADRDAVDLRIVNEVRSGTGRIIDHPSDVGGWPVLTQNQRPLTTPANPNGDDDGDGYTNLEEWLHQMAAQVEGRAP